MFALRRDVLMATLDAGLSPTSAEYRRVESTINDHIRVAHATTFLRLFPLCAYYIVANVRTPPQAEPEIPEYRDALRKLDGIAARMLVLGSPLLVVSTLMLTALVTSYRTFRNVEAKVVASKRDLDETEGLALFTTE